MLNTTTREAGPSCPSWTIRRTAAIVAAPSGERNSPSWRFIQPMKWSVSASGTPTAQPRVARSARRIRKSANGFTTMMPGAIVSTCFAPRHSSSPSWNALTTAPPGTCTETSRGRALPIQPSSSSSSKTFHIPMIPTPPPVG